eukprot:CAMPEP_0177563972 /NCGR_PEP_ID=MMETSP0369-20130122/73378_1 /TAXON_ID=447022 ORGANISM="Scrippsiella hangoei-like, Strain SHHI-4" /NCGR_SAMPLE_ID=MMETSP0369 /ASSEMBLY_ACC=CAM_ASM_000364 /LENGTH=86 /DNA_ID=CAMNT_0019051251 /DNA_START=219 /DNA_END=477 /DNA_ORIENTATION=+
MPSGPPLAPPGPLANTTALQQALGSRGLDGLKEAMQSVAIIRYDLQLAGHVVQEDPALAFAGDPVPANLGPIGRSHGRCLSLILCL